MGNGRESWYGSTLEDLNREHNNRITCSQQRAEQGNFPLVFRHKTNPDETGQAVQESLGEAVNSPLMKILSIQPDVAPSSFAAGLALSGWKDQVIFRDLLQSKLNSTMVFDQKLPLSIGIKQDLENGYSQYLGREL